MKAKKTGRVFLKILWILLAAILLFTLGTYISHRIKTAREIALLKEKGYHLSVCGENWKL